ncbi:MAG: hypothetical protein M3Q48_13275, partial [Actinomycetota bacterium]|nr:hypothetical protein [Actinomycetota bacterium]
AVADAELGAALVTLSELAPALLPAFVVAAATSARRSLALGRVLANFGATDEATQVVQAGLEVDAGYDTAAAAEARAWLREVTPPTAQVGRP